MTLLIAFVLSSAVQSPSQPAVKPPLLDQIACAPMGLPAPPPAGLRVLGGYVHGRLMFAPGDALIVNAGTGQGLQPGQQYFVRRLVNDASKKQPKVGALYGALKRRKVPVKMVTYPRTPHGIQEPKLMQDAMTRNLDWFDEWVLGKKGAAAAGN